METPEIILERHEQRIQVLEREISVMKEVQSEIRSMNETLVVLAGELKHTNEHLGRHEQKITEIENVPRIRTREVVTAVIIALASFAVTALLGAIFT